MLQEKKNKKVFKKNFEINLFFPQKKKLIFIWNIFLDFYLFYGTRMIGFFPKEMKKGEKNSILNFFKFFVAPHKFFVVPQKDKHFFLVPNTNQWF